MVNVEVTNNTSITVSIDGNNNDNDEKQQSQVEVPNFTRAVRSSSSTLSRKSNRAPFFASNDTRRQHISTAFSVRRTFVIHELKVLEC